jgi:hypothetical protein
MPLASRLPIGRSYSFSSKKLNCLLVVLFSNQVQTHVYYPKDEKYSPRQECLSTTQSHQLKILDLKKFIVKDTWAQWMTKVLDEIVAHEELQSVLYEHQNNFFLEDAYHRDISLESVTSNKIKKYLHEILTNAIFEYNPCKELLLGLKKAPPSKDE